MSRYLFHHTPQAIKGYFKNTLTSCITEAPQKCLTAISISSPYQKNNVNDCQQPASSLRKSNKRLTKLCSSKPLTPHTVVTSVRSRLQECAAQSCILQSYWSESEPSRRGRLAWCRMPLVPQRSKDPTPEQHRRSCKLCVLEVQSHDSQKHLQTLMV